MHENTVTLSLYEIKTLLFVVLTWGSYFFLAWVLDGTPNIIIWIRDKVRKMLWRMHGKIGKMKIGEY